MMTVQYAFDFGKEGFAFFCVSPGVSLDSVLFCGVVRAD